MRYLLDRDLTSGERSHPSEQLKPGLYAFCADIRDVAIDHPLKSVSTNSPTSIKSVLRNFCPLVFRVFFNLQVVEEPILTHQCSARLQDELSVVQSNYRIHYSFFFKPRVEHVHREHFTPLSNRTHLKMTENSIHSTRDISRKLAFLISRSRGLSLEPSLLATPPSPPPHFSVDHLRERKQLANNSKVVKIIAAKDVLKSYLEIPKNR